MKKIQLFLLSLFIVTLTIINPVLITGEEVPITNRTFSRIIQNSISSVVSIHGVIVPEEHPQRRLLPEQDFFGFPFEELFRRFPQQQMQPRTTLGTGFLISSDGYIVTNLHVIDGVKAEDIRIEFHDGEIFEKGQVEIRGVDENTDIAILKVPGNDFSYLEFGNSDKVEIGEFVIALGNPFGQLHSASLGIVSATGRQLRDFGGTRGVPIEFQNFIQTDAAINPGNSGGPLLDIHGKVIAVNNIISTTSGGSIGLGYAIAGNEVSNVAQSLIEYGEVERGWIGVIIRDVDHELKEFYQVDRGVLVTDVTTGGPADKAGMSRDEVIIKVNDIQITNTRDLVSIITVTRPGSEVTVTVIDRDGQEKQYQIITGTRPSRDDLLARRHIIPDTFLGMQLQGLTPDLREQLDVSPDINGVVITSVESDSDAHRKGVQRGDVLIEINRQEVSNIDDVKRIIETIGDQSRILLVLHREDSNHYVVISNE